MLQLVLPALLAVSAPSSSAAAPPMPVTTTAPPVVITPTAPAGTPRPIVQFDIRVSGEEGQIWDGGLRVGGMGGNYRQDLSEAAPELCEPQGSDVVQRRDFSIMVRPGNYRSPDSYVVSVSWTRPLPGKGCGRNGTRSVQLQQTVTIQPGETITLRGDAGLIVQMKRR